MANTVPAAAWTILHILLDQSLVSRLRKELLHEINDANSPIDLKALLSASLLNSVYRETLRLHVASAVGRKTLGAGLRLHGDCLSSITPGSTGMSANWLGGLDESFWNTGRIIDGVAEHPVQSFWAERFLEYPDDPTSGPVRNRAGSVSTTWAEINQSAREKTVADDSKARLANLAALRGHFFPFGGGAWKCPGETLAKSTILVSVFLLLRDLDIEILDPVNAAKTRSKHRAMPFGTHAFDRAVPIRVRKRLDA